MKIFAAVSAFVGLSDAQWATNYQAGHAGMVHLFEWHWGWIAEGWAKLSTSYKLYHLIVWHLILRA